LVRKGKKNQNCLTPRNPKRRARMTDIKKTEEGEEGQEEGVPIASKKKGSRNLRQRRRKRIGEEMEIALNREPRRACGAVRWNVHLKRGRSSEKRGGSHQSYKR